MNAEVIKEIANQLGIAASAVTKDMIPAYASCVIAARISNIIVLALSLLLFWFWLDFLFPRVRNMLIGSMKS